MVQVQVVLGAHKLPRIRTPTVTLPVEVSQMSLETRHSRMVEGLEDSGEEKEVPWLELSANQVSLVAERYNLREMARLRVFLVEALEAWASVWSGAETMGQRHLVRGHPSHHPFQTCR